MLDALVPKEEDSAKQDTGDLLECYFLQALYTSLGATLQPSDRIEFDANVKKFCSLMTIVDSVEQRATIRKYSFSYFLWFQIQLLS